MMRKLLPGLQRVGGALMLPIAVLPIAGLLLRLGQPDLLHLTIVSAAGEAIFSNLGLLFAVGVAVGLARENHGAAGLAAVVCYLVATKGAESMMAAPPGTLAGLSGSVRDLALSAYRDQQIAMLSVPTGILSGLIAGALYNRYSRLELPSYLAFFGGRRFIPIVSGVAGLGLAVVFGLEWQRLEQGMDALSHSILHAGAFGLFVYGVLNRVLIVTGLHHIVNNIAWFLLGNFHGVTGDSYRFFAGDPTAGAFMAGFFPVMMFGLPAACLAMYHAAPPERRPEISGLLGSIALTSILTGVTEPVEFTFMFLAPSLYAVHALLTGIAFPIMNALQVRLGFGFSAGLFDYLLNFRLATRPLLLLPVGALYFLLYYGIFRYAIVRFDLKTPGREPVDVLAKVGEAPSVAPPATGAVGTAGVAAAFITALGGPENLRSVDACTTRLRLTVADQARVDVGVLKRLGASGVVRPSPETLQVVLGPQADRIAGEIREELRASGAGQLRRDGQRTVQSAAERLQRGPAAAERDLLGARSLLAALGGARNVRSFDVASTRLRIELGDAARVDERTFATLGLRGIAKIGAGWIHVIVGPDAARWGADLQSLLGRG